MAERWFFSLSCSLGEKYLTRKLGTFLILLQFLYLLQPLFPATFISQPIQWLGVHTLYNPEKLNSLFVLSALLYNAGQIISPSDSFAELHQGAHPLNKQLIWALRWNKRIP